MSGPVSGPGSGGRGPDADRKVYGARRAAGARAGALLDLAELVLSGSLQVPRGTRARAAAVLARTALEDTVTALCLHHSIDVVSATMRVRLACLMAVSRPVAGRAGLAWWGLSRACHQHAYEIAPHFSEVEHLIRTVGDLIRAVPGQGTPASRAEPSMRSST